VGVQGAVADHTRQVRPSEEGGEFRQGGGYQFVVDGPGRFGNDLRIAVGEEEGQLRRLLPSQSDDGGRAHGGGLVSDRLHEEFGPDARGEGKRSGVPEQRVSVVVFPEHVEQVVTQTPIDPQGQAGNRLV
jgi:hypothetical protein